MTSAQRALAVIDRLKAHYPATCSLVAQKDYELLFATRLSAQCTDMRVNDVTRALFARYPTLESIAGSDYDELCELIKPCGLFRVKGRDIRLCAQILLDRHGGRVPDTLEELLALPGVGRKTANLILSDLYGKPGVVADTHCMRISNRLGLVSCGNDPLKVEQGLTRLLPPEEQADYCHRTVHFGREVCTARAPKCTVCPLSDLCAHYIRSQRPPKL